MKDLLLTLNLQFFADTEDAEVQLAAPTPESTEKNAVESPVDDVKKEKTFTQAELDEIIAKRLERETKKYADYAQLKDAAEKAQTYSQELEQANERANKAILEREFFKAATSANIEYVDDALKLADLSGVVFKDGKVEGVADAVAALVENKPFLVKAKEPKTIGKPAGAADNRNVEEHLLREAAEKVKKGGSIADRVRFAQLKRQYKK